MDYVIAFLILIGVLVIVHELGHFLFAKLFGVRVEIFSVGFGPSILNKQMGETQYRISLIPLGGYVKLYGEEDNTSDPRAFSSKSPIQKILIAFAGPLFNFLFAILVISLLWMYGMDVPSYELEKPIVGYVVENSLASRMGVKEGDLIVEVNSRPVKTWQDVRKVYMQALTDKEIELKVLRGSEVISLKGAKVGLNESLGVEPLIPPVVGHVLKGSPAYDAGIRPMDVVLEINNVPVRTWQDIVRTMSKVQDQVVNLKIKRGQEVYEKTVVAKKDPKTGRYILGIAPDIKTVKIRKGPIDALYTGVERTYELSVLTLKSIAGMITGKVPLRDSLGGPLTIAQLAGESIQQSYTAFLNMMVLISINLALINLLPLPVLDGGLILLFVLEGIRRRPMPERFKEIWYKIGIALVALLTLLALTNDLMRFLRH